MGVGQTQACETYAYAELGQAWDPSAAEYWYSQSQGSRLIPDRWYRALRRADDGAPFAERSSMARYGFAYCDDKAADPIGFVLDSDERREPAVGLNCAACHTGVLLADDGPHIVHGGAAAMDLQGFTADLFDAVEATWRGAGVVPDARFRAFADDVLGADHSQEARDALQGQMRDWLSYRWKIQESIEDGGEWGHGRQDAVTVILNTVATLSGPRADDRLPAATGPVSIPAAWNAPRTDRVQWNGSSFKSEDIGLTGEISTGAMIRNISEVIGVFAEVRMPAYDQLAEMGYPGMETSVRLANLIRHERALAVLAPPLWPEAWPASEVGSAAYDQGKALYEKHCVACHARIDRDQPQQPIVDATGRMGVAEPFVRVVPAFPMPDTGPISVGTDPMTACNALTHTTWTGKFSAYTDVFSALRQYNTAGVGAVQLARFAPGAQTLGVIADMSVRIIYEKRDEILQVQAEDLAFRTAAFFDGVVGGDYPVQGGAWIAGQATEATTPMPATHHLADLDEVRQECARLIADQRRADPQTLWPGYKAGPLAGVFATAPYLHNGSVPTLWHMLTPEARPDRFAIGAVAFDPVRVGLGAPVEGGAASEFSVRDGAGGVIPGNSNQGHAFPPGGLTEAEKEALIAYLRRL